MAERKKPPVERKIVDVSKGTEKTASTAKAYAPTPEAKKSARGLRIGAVILWVLAIAAEVVAILMLTRYIFIPEESLVIWLIVALGVDLVLLVIGSQLWKRANHKDPASKKNKFKFWLWNNLGLIVSVIAFLPILILLLNDKKLDGKAKKLVSIVAAVALLIGGLASYDWNPISQEELTEAQVTANEIGDGRVAWTTFGRRFHLYEDCSSLNYSATLFIGTVAEASEAGRAELCKICEARAEAGERALPFTDVETLTVDEDGEVVDEDETRVVEVDNEDEDDEEAA